MRVIARCASKGVLLLIISVFPGKTNAQPAFPPTDTHTLIDSLVNTIPPAKYYLIGQAHNNSANLPIEQELLFTLNRKYGLIYDVLEYSHSSAMILNEFLRSGADSLLRMTHPEAAFTFLRAVKKFNDTVAESRKIRFYGIDFEGRYNDLHLKKAIDIVLYQTRLKETTVLYGILNKIQMSDKDAIRVHLQELKAFLENDELMSRNLLGAYYLDLLLVANAQYGFSPKRDDAMYSNFLRLYRELIKTGISPLFFSSFGYAHIQPGNTGSIVNQLRSTGDSPVRDRIAVIGVQYYQSSFNKSGQKKWVGNLSFLCKEKSLQPLEIMGADGKRGLYLLSGTRLASLSCDPAIEKLDAVLLIYNTGSTQYYIWE